MGAEIEIPDKARRAAANVPAPIPAEHDRVSSYAMRVLMQAAPLILAAELERIAAGLHTSSRMDDLIGTAEAAARNGVRNELLARASELRGEG